MSDREILVEDVADYRGTALPFTLRIAARDGHVVIDLLAGSDGRGCLMELDQAARVVDALTQAVRHIRRDRELAQFEDARRDHLRLQAIKDLAGLPRQLIDYDAEE